MLEIGKGNGLVSDYFRRAGVDVTTVDINPALKPDICGSILELADLVDGRRFDVVLCAEVLEHLPHENFDQCLEQMAKVAGDRVVITLPSCWRSPIDLGVALKFAFMRRWFPRLYIPLYRRPIAAEHHWEVGSSKQTGRRAVARSFSKHFDLDRSFREFLKPYHVFYILNAKSGGG